MAKAGAVHRPQSDKWIRRFAIKCLMEKEIHLWQHGLQLQKERAVGLTCFQRSAAATWPGRRRAQALGTCRGSTAALGRSTLPGRPSTPLPTHGILVLSSLHRPMLHSLT